VAHLRDEVPSSGGDARRVHSVGGSPNVWRTKWDEEIQRYLRCCDVFVLLVSPNSTGSTYIIDKELQIARERQAAGDDLHVYPLLLKPTAEAELDRVRDFNLRPRDAKPLSGYSLQDRNRHMSYAADEIAEIAAQIARRKAAATRTAPAASTPKRQSWCD
jgi:hypothetical protein